MKRKRLTPDRVRGRRAVQAWRREFAGMVKQEMTPDLRHLVEDAARTKVNLMYLDKYIVQLQEQDATKETVKEVLTAIRERTKLSVGLMKLFTRLGVGREERRDVSKKEQRQREATEALRAMREKMTAKPAEENREA